MPLQRLYSDAARKRRQALLKAKLNEANNQENHQDTAKKPADSNTQSSPQAD